jgi:hypothetical protein
VIAGAWQSSDPRIDPGFSQARCESGAEQDVIEAHPRVSFPCLSQVIPERVDGFVWVSRLDRIRPVTRPAKHWTSLRISQSMKPSLRLACRCASCRPAGTNGSLRPWCLTRCSRLRMCRDSART